MEWITANWFWILFGILFIGMHFFGHGGHGGGHQHGGKNTVESGGDETKLRVVNKGSSGHQH